MTLLIRFREGFLLNDDIGSWQWAKVLVRENKDGVLETKYQRIPDYVAEEIIEREGLEKVERDNTMQIWDTPDRAFQNEYKGRIVVNDLR